MEKKNPITPSIRRTFKGIVVSDKMDKTIVVAVKRIVRHRLYGKSYERTRNLKVHDAKNQFHVGDVVEFVECHPLSRDKRWEVLL